MPRLSRTIRLLLLHWIPVAVYMTLVFYFSSRQQLPGGFTLGPYDKAAHFGQYFVLGLLLGRASRATLPGMPAAAPWILALFIGMGIGAADETLQAFVPGRYSTMSDFLADTAGVLAAQAVIHLPRRRHTRARIAMTEGR